MGGLERSEEQGELEPEEQEELELEEQEELEPEELEGLEELERFAAFRSHPKTHIRRVGARV